ncbi:MAG: endonuclease [Gammaproteobacteria bacterium]|nr:endonuclease [Gammaproteobacteria bacterium]
MLRIITWNIQCGRGVDGRIDLMRTAAVIREMADADVICLQEVSRFDPELDDGKGADQVAILASCFPSHEPVFGSALDRLGHQFRERRQFGNLILSRLPIIQIFSHLLPQPVPATPCKHMPRQALEVVIEGKDGPLRVITTHLEYHCARQRLAQAAYLCELQREITANQSYSKVAPSSGPYAAAARPPRSIICGDLNSTPDDAVYRALSTPMNCTSRSYYDAWRVIHGNSLHAPTVGIYDHQQWPAGPHCRDFFFVSSEFLDVVSEFRVQQETDASDHQPLLMSVNS